MSQRYQHFCTPANACEISSVLSTNEKLGWELVAVTALGSTYRLFFKRPFDWGDK